MSDNTNTLKIDNFAKQQKISEPNEVINHLELCSLDWKAKEADLH